MLTKEERNNLIIDYIHFAEQLASIQFRKTPPCVQLDELKSAAYMGLVDAASKYEDQTRPFSVYASFRICGEIKDYLRTLRWGGRSCRSQTNSWSEEYDYAAEQENDDFNEFFDDFTKNISPIGKKILYLYYVANKTIKEIGHEIGLSSTRIHQLLKSNLATLQGVENA